MIIKKNEATVATFKYDNKLSMQILFHAKYSEIFSYSANCRACTLLTCLINIYQMNTLLLFGPGSLEFM